VRALFIQQDHVSPTGPVGDRVRHHGYDIDEFLVVPAERFETPDVAVTFPDPRDYDLIVPMGAAWSVYDATRIPWITDQLALLREAHEHGVAILGICFGGQALASALGGSVRPAPEPEIGWYGIETDDESLVGPGPWFQWHYDQFVPPPGARVIARTPVGPQAFVLGSSLGVQFHPELTPSQLVSWIDNGGDSSLAAAGIDADELVRRTEETADQAAARTHALVDSFVAHVAAAVG
jgi:GMP synthase-like glutamine amidotransferase